MNRNKETWKPILFDFEYTNTSRYEVSNWGRIRSFNKISNGNIVKGSMSEGYPIIRFKFYQPRSKEIALELEQLERETSELQQKKSTLIKENAPTLVINRVAYDLDKKLKNIRKKKAKDLKKRTVHKHFFIHRLVADFFLPTPKSKETIVGHLDYYKCNNNVSNLKWMTPEENKIHTEQSPYVIAEKKERKYRNKKNRKDGWKLSSTQVMRIKILLKKGKTLREIAKHFNVSDMQI
ncbi:MAG TPA: NUMOD4 domain-containing protein, partial [Flavobacteriaceae bacterium]|nr:NUMOD4 domain-containing protein [Flavobacteriaceae bacterium]